MPLPAREGVQQDPQVDFEKEILSACQQHDLKRIQSLISQHRLWVKPSVDHLTANYIEASLSGNHSEGEQLKGYMRLIAQEFLETFGESSLVTATGYLDVWNLSDLKKKSRADSLTKLAIPIRNKEPEHEKAIKYYRDAIELYNEIGDLRGAAEVEGALGFIQFYRTYWYGEDPQILVDQYERALETRMKVNDLELVGKSLNDLGAVYLNFLKDYPRAIGYLEQAVEIREVIGDTTRLGSSLQYLALSFKNNGQLEEALHNFERSLLINTYIGNTKRMAEAYDLSGNIHKDRSNYNEALRLLNLALDLRMQLGDPNKVSNVLNSLGWVHAEIGNQEKALELYLKADSIMNENDYLSGQADVYNNIANLLIEMERPESAETYYLKSIAIFRDLELDSKIPIGLGNLGNVYYDMGKYLLSEEYQQRAMAKSKQLKLYDIEIHNLINLSNAQNALGKLDSAFFHCSLALEKAKELGNPKLIWLSTLNLGDNYEKRGEFQKSLEYYDEALEIVEEIRTSLTGEEYRANYMAMERFAYQGIIHLLGKLHTAFPESNYGEKAFEYAERSKSRSLLDLIAENSEPISIPDLRQSIPNKETVILEYFLGDSSSCLWILDKKDLHMLVLPARDDLVHDIETLRFSMNMPDKASISFFAQSSQKLYDILIKPAEKQIKRKRNLVIIPDRELFYLPFEVLLTGSGSLDKEDLTSLPYLVKGFSISYGASASILAQLGEDGDKKEVENPNLLALGNPEYGPGYKALNYSAEEVIGIGSLFGSSNSTLLLEENAGEGILKTRMKDAYEYIHFATHGSIDEYQPGRSSLVLSGQKDDNEDGFLRAEEIKDLDLDVELVTLSACQTGLGKMVRGEGLLGLTRSFFSAGASSVMVSLWSVADQSTSTLMLEFYENLLKKGMNKSVALQQSQLSMIADAKLAHPFYWAPFILVGNWQ